MSAVATRKRCSGEPASTIALSTIPAVVGSMRERNNHKRFCPYCQKCFVVEYTRQAHCKSESCKEAHIRAARKARYRPKPKTLRTCKCGCGEAFVSVPRKVWAHPSHKIRWEIAQENRLIPHDLLDELAEAIATRSYVDIRELARKVLQDG